MHSNEHLPVNIGNPVEFTIRECAREVLTATRPPARWYSNPCRKMIRSSGSRTFRRREEFSAGIQRFNRRKGFD